MKRVKERERENEKDKEYLSKNARGTWLMSFHACNFQKGIAKYTTGKGK